MPVIDLWALILLKLTQDHCGAFGVSVGGISHDGPIMH